jgi:AcrR family transcriptional regulator
MGARAETVAATRHAIVEAAMALHQRQGVQATSWDEIAAAAGVSSATVYRHFPSPTELIPACAHTVFDVIQPPTLAQVAPKFAACDDPADRLEQLVRDTVHCYAQGEGWLHAAYRERDFIVPLADAIEVIESTLRVLVRAAAGTRLSKSAESELFVLCNFPMWKQLVDSGLGPRQATEANVQLVRDAWSRTRH